MADVTIVFDGNFPDDIVAVLAFQINPTDVPRYASEEASIRTSTRLLLYRGSATVYSQNAFSESAMQWYDDATYTWSGNVTEIDEEVIITGNCTLTIS